MLQIIKDNEYTKWIAELSHRYRQSQIMQWIYDTL